MLDINYLKSNGVDVDKSLELFGDMDTYNETFKDYLDGIDEKLALLKEYKEKADWLDYGVEAHSIKSDARYLGFASIAKVALDHEMAGKGEDSKFILQEYDNLVNATNKMTEIVKNYLNGESSTTVENVEAKEKDSDAKNVLLIADDSSLVTNFIIRSLDNKYETMVAVNGREVIDIINRPDVKVIGLLLDLNMPVMNGFEVLEYFKENNLFDSIPTSIITGEDSKDMVDKAFTYQIKDMLVKPFSNKEVLRVLEKTIL